MIERFATLALENISDPNLCGTIDKIVSTDRFWTWPAALGMHHAYEGGLATHTFEVASLALSLAAPFKEVVNRDVLLASALWHDYAKIHDYAKEYDIDRRRRHLPIASEPGAYWVTNDYARRIHHINGSCAAFTATAVACGVDEKTIHSVQHAILAHHGPVKEWGSPVEPQSLEAMLLHYADNLSAHHGPTK